MGTTRIPYAFLICLILLAGISALYLSCAYGFADGRFVAPLDDAYITYQYARQIARGQPFRYNDGDAPTTGMTSLLFGYLLAGFYKLGITGENLVAVSVGMGIFWLGVIALVTYQIAKQLCGNSSHLPTLTAILVLLTGSIQWGCFNGMETGLFTVLTLAALNAYMRRKIAYCALYLGLSGLTRPEGLILSCILSATLFIYSWLSQEKGPRKHLIYMTGAILGGFIPFAVNYYLTGTVTSSGLQAKSWLENVPQYMPGILQSIFSNLRRIVLGRYMGAEWYVIPGLLVLALWGWGSMVRDRLWTLLGVTFTWFLVGSVSTSILITALWHLGRYQIPFVPILLLACVYSFQKLEKEKRYYRHKLLYSLLFLMLICSINSTFVYSNLYQQAVSTVTRQQLVIADWLRDNLPPDAWVGIHDAGSLKYISQRQTYDLIGLTTPDAAISWRNGAGSVYESMEKSPIRPTYFAIYPDIYSIPYLANTDLFAEELFKVVVPDYAIASAGPTQGVWKADWHLTNSGDVVYQNDIKNYTFGMDVMDSIDIGDLSSESAHEITWWQETMIPGFPTELQQMKYRVQPDSEVLDGGRLITGGIEFTVASRPASDMCLVSRLHPREKGSLQVMVDNQDVGQWKYPAVPGEWLETCFCIPGSFITSNRTRIQFLVDDKIPEFRHYGVYYLWVLQGKYTPQPTAGTYQLNARFQPDILLQSYDISSTIVYPGDILNITLYWSTESYTESDAKVFLHLYDRNDYLRQQSDGWPYLGTRPLYTWYPGEVVSDPHHILLPTDLPAGRYTLETGLYDLEGRLPAYVEGQRQFEERVLVTTIEVKTAGD